MFKVYKTFALLFGLAAVSLMIPNEVNAAQYTNAGSGYNLSAQDRHVGTYKGVKSMTYYTRTSYSGRISNSEKHYAYVRSKSIGVNYFGQSSNDVYYNGVTTSAEVERVRQQDNTHFHAHTR